AARLLFSFQVFASELKVAPAVFLLGSKTRSSALALASVHPPQLRFGGGGLASTTPRFSNNQCRPDVPFLTPRRGFCSWPAVQNSDAKPPSLAPLVATFFGLIVLFHLGSALLGNPLYRAQHLGTALEYAHG